MLVYFLPEKNGKANDLIIEIANEIINFLNSNKLRVVTVSTGRNNAYNIKCMETFSIYRDSLLEDCPTVVNSALKSIKNFNGTFWISDMLHLLKLGRK